MQLWVLLLATSLSVGFVMAFLEWANGTYDKERGEALMP
jgi:hypothetical protein